MENLKQQLKKLKSVTPDDEYVLQSRRDILDTPTTGTVFHSWKVFVRIVESAAAIGFAGLLILLAIGGISLWDRSPSLSGLDPSALRVEAQAIDFQIQLTGLDYEDLAPPEQESTLSSVVGDLSRDLLDDEEEEANEDVVQQEPTESATSTGPTDIDEALDILAE